jgi:uncharacterized membrane protein YadS
VLPQVLAGLGVSLVSAACQLWLEHLQPLFFAVAIASLGYQIWLVRVRPPARRKTGVRTVLAVSLLLNVIVVGGWMALMIRYR